MKTFIVTFCFLITLSVAVIGSAGPVSDDPSRPQMQEGKLITVQLKPTSKRIEILIAGKEATNFELSRAGVTAEIYFGSKVIKFKPKLKDGKYSIENNAVSGASKLKIEVKDTNAIERFDFDVPLAFP